MSVIYMLLIIVRLLIRSYLTLFFHEQVLKNHAVCSDVTRDSEERVALFF